MRTVSASITDELYVALQDFCNENNTNTNQALGKAIQGLLEGKVKMRPLGGRDICPRCGHTVHLVQDNSKFYFACFNCDWAGCLGEYSLPEQIEDLTKKLLEED